MPRLRSLVLEELSFENGRGRSNSQSVALAKLEKLAFKRFKQTLKVASGAFKEILALFSEIGELHLSKVPLRSSTLYLGPGVALRVRSIVMEYMDIPLHHLICHNQALRLHTDTFESLSVTCNTEPHIRDLGKVNQVFGAAIRHLEIDMSLRHVDRRWYIAPRWEEAHFECLTGLRSASLIMHEFWRHPLPGCLAVLRAFVTCKSPVQEVTLVFAVEEGPMASITDFPPLYWREAGVILKGLKHLEKVFVFWNDFHLPMNTTPSCSLTRLTFGADLRKYIRSKLPELQAKGMLWFD
ncbi:hypothetical protein PHLCEN_2v9938 [Hermanssonia centrifuga]|uniref:Uncharacterized protein n=1 Tax=Hermanssonia centrifuga TaxID=98765 RepID=A0A2R6NPA9_9APHY|nr:hypothetical protein PHLCEN_2v9938 [Hermanssonia centrifuga]